MSWKAAPLLFILMTRPRPPKLPLLAYPKERFYRQPSLLFISPTCRTPPNTPLALYADDTAILAQSWRTDTIVHRLTHAMSVLLRYFTRWKLQYSQNRGHSLYSTPSCSPSISPLPTHCNPVGLTSPISRSPTRPQIPIHETFNLRNT
jgi:hypothetical protein